MFRIKLPFQTRDRGAVDGMKRLLNHKVHELAVSLVIGVAPAIPVGRKDDLAEHLDMVRQEFVGRTEIEYTHAALIVLLRRGIAEKRSWKRFQQVWEECGPFLLQRLNTRWLISACDTIADFSPDRAERALALAGSLLMNTIKLYETEIWMKATEAKEYERIPQGGMTLFDGVTPFMVGAGDMIANLNTRVQSLCEKQTIASNILQEIFRRIHVNPTVFQRFQALHTSDLTKWSA
ncbi:MULTISPECIES: hypothetical protein [unclassified Mesorhizobium]|uniref:hypothetical protein n=1 Tax=unclassified Mesorhizobium TaxID=325217 RepID=UPI0003CE6B48|nr:MULTISPECIES: hypothetical protein [unclassified Mesorhizobium]ESY53105.1 hypothetical protein X745_17590 [Mesorhizobium sp. LNJC374B00]ESY59717.1 hypothetical protein X744_11500 [Mesorhizobium sp. LNJC372A00]ESZ58290.1 hypothetical protein X729_19630 [Mesorhizobium sp. L103C131B0]ESZ60158.1 hypothetical protein X728_16960 [Mesorhizobium sp. L103C120A0]WJI44039.1 hypothetical protein NL532_25990 [Mesorhizobium sp. C120A]